MIFNTATPAGNAGGGIKRHNLSNLLYLTSRKEGLR